MIEKLDLRDMETEKRIIELQKASYVIEAELIGFYDIPPLKDTIDSLRVCDETFYGYSINGLLAGIISYKIIKNVLDIHRLAIHPDFFRMGIAGKLIDYIEKLECGISKAIVSTGNENLPAVNFYLKNGYKKKNDIEISKGINIMKFEKILR